MLDDDSSDVLAVSSSVLLPDSSSLFDEESSSVVVDNYPLTGLGVERVKVYGVLGLVSCMNREILLPWIKLKESAL